MTLMSLIEQGGIALIPLGICSILVVAVILERVWIYSRTGKVPKELMRRIEGLVYADQWQEALRLLEDYDSSYARIAKASLMRKNASIEEITDVLTLACDAEVALATRPLPVLGTIGNIAPFIGLFGTVLGIMHAFRNVSDPGKVSQGIAEALIATAIGLGVAIVAVVANNWCNAWVERYRLDLERFATEWSYRLHHLQQTIEVIETEPVA